MGVLDRFEKGIERVVNGAFAKAFRSQVEPVELAGALRREADTRAAVVSRGRTLTANHYTVELASSDFERLSAIEDELRTDLRQVVGEHAIEQGYSFVGPVAVQFHVAEDLDTGMYRVTSTTQRPDGSPAAQPANRGGYDPPSRSNPIVSDNYHSGPVGAAAAPSSPRTSLGTPRGRSTATSSAPTSARPTPGHTPTAGVRVQGTFHPLREGTTVFGRSANSADIVLDDPGISRRHFEITLNQDHAVATDLGSTNGTLLAGRRITSITLTPGTTLTAGDTEVTFVDSELGG